MTISTRRTLVAMASLLAIALLGACSDSGEQRAASELEDAGRTAVGNVERSEKIMADTYDEEREKGQGRVEAAGDAYNAVLDAARE